MPLNRNKTGQLMLIKALPLMRLAADRYAACLIKWTLCKSYYKSTYICTDKVT